MSAYGEFKKMNVVYCTYLFAGERGLLDFDETRIYLNALKAFDIMEKEAIEDAFGEGIYEVSLVREWWSVDKLVKAECLKKDKIKQGDAR